jgi:hypothetical protein
MFQWFWRLLYESTPAEFRSSFGLAESVERLRAATKRSVFSSLSETAAVGKVTQKTVRLQRVIPMVGNSFKPFFIGRFEVRDGVTVLAGRFSMLTYAKVFMTAWLAMALLFAVAMLFVNFRSPHPVPGFFVLQPFLMLGFGIALVAVGKWFSRNDPAWLSKVIEGTLGGSRQGVAGPISVVVADSSAVPMPLKCTSLFFAILGLLSLVARLVPPAATNINAGMDPVLATRPLGGLNYAVGVAFIVLAVGIWVRRPWAWWAVFVVIAAAYVQPLFTVFRDIRVSPPIAFQVIFGVLGLAISVIWGLWWYAQRKYFLRARP